MKMSIGGGRGQVLVVGVEPGTTTSVRGLLERHDYRVRVAATYPSGRGRLDEVQ